MSFKMLLLRKHVHLSITAINVFLVLIFILSSTYSGCASSNIKANKEDATAMEDMGRSFVLQGNSREGLSYLLKAEGFDPNNPDIEHQLALVYEDIGEYDLSLQHFKKAISLKSNFSDAVNNMGILYSKMKEWDKALGCFQQAVSDVLYRTPEFGYHNMGLVYFYKGDYSSAIEKYQKALQLAPSYTTVYYDLASVYIVLDRYEDAVECYKKAAELTPQLGQANLSLARLYIKMNKQQEARDELKNIIEFDPRSQAAKEANQLLSDLNKK
jgi:Tfp pilus assembly protein PilF